MVNIHLPEFDYIRNMIKNMKRTGNDWGKIEENFEALKIMGAIQHDLSKDTWGEIIREQKYEYHKAENIEKIEIETTIVSLDENNKTYVPTDARSSWQLYKNKLLKNGWREDAVNNLEKSTISILRKLNNDTRTTGPVKGLVIGQVQSGKTASMAGLMAMAADWGWNMFIVLSGMIENLRLQTQDRLINDLNNPGNNNWRSLHKLSKRSQIGDLPQALNFEETSTQKYLNVCLKNKTRLENLIGWLKSDKKKSRQMKILVIDDEADQGSINTKNIDKDERAKINELIIKLIEVSKGTEYQPKSMNYICYTATPYSNFLNESSDDSLYPKDFIGILPVSNEYFGPKQIFGLEGSEEYEGLDIIRQISEEDLECVKELHDAKIEAIPKSLQDSICWFICITAVMRFNKYKKPVSMLVHTSQKQAHHDLMSRAITKWICNLNKRKLTAKCKGIYELEREQFNLDKFQIGYKEYPVPNDEINGYPEFDQIKSFIEEIIETNISHIIMDEEGELDYHKGIHLCIDNSANNGITEEDTYIRLAYPGKEKLKELNTAPAFIIVGGNTLSRGLTIEGLVSTYFLRAATAADSLMQMGRWFGYRKGYELLPRIWMTQNTYDKFFFLTLLEEELREELEQFALDHKSPSEYGPRVKNTPKASWLRVTAKNKMQKAEEIEMDFSGASIQTIHFENNKIELRKNIDTAENFLQNYCGRSEKSKIANAIVYRDVDFNKIKNEFLLKMIFNQRSKAFDQIDVFCDWYEKVQNEINFKNWNVIVAGAGKVEEGYSKGPKKWYLGDYTVGMVNRSAKASSMNYKDGTVNIGVLRGPNDVYADIKDESCMKEISKKGVKNKDIREIRQKFGLGDVPQLIIYRITKDSEARNSAGNKDETKSDRIDLNFDEDIIGVYIHVPGDNSNKPHAKALRVIIDNDDDE